MLSGTRSLATTIAWWTIGLVALAIAFLHVANHFGIRKKLCETPDSRCTSQFALSSIALLFQPKLPAALRVEELRANVTTALLRRRCDGGWTAGLGARIDMEGATVGDLLEVDGGCADVDPGGVRGETVGARLHIGQCIVRIDALRLHWQTALTGSLTANIEPDAAAACGALVTQSTEPAIAQLLAVAQITLDVRYEVPFQNTQATRSNDTHLRAEDYVGGWVRQALRSADTHHALRLTVPTGSAAVELRSSRRSEPAQGSPEMELLLGAEGSVLAMLPAELKTALNDDGHLQVRWNLDHETGRLFVNDRQVMRVASTPRAPGRTALTAAECGAKAATESRALFFVEADDRGDSVAPSQVEAVLRAVDEANANAGSLVGVFVHGWQHSAAAGDSYVCSFSELIAAVDAMERHAARLTGRAPRHVIGVYVGWPGHLYPSEIANSLTTFWNRLNVADRLGHEGSVLRRLVDGLAHKVAAHGSDVRADRASALIVTGHSMGGRAVFHAMRNHLLEASESTSEKYAGNLVLLINPAFSADLYRAVHQRDLACSPPAVPLLLFSSEVDAVTRKVYPVGQTATFPYGSTKAAPFLEHIYTAANFPDFVTHRLRMQILDGEPPPPDGEHTILRGFQRVPVGSNELYSDDPVNVYRQPSSGYPRVGDLWYRMRLEHLSTKQPCLEGGSKVIEVDRRILPDHGTIFTPPFMEYVVRALNGSVRALPAPNLPPRR